MSFIYPRIINITRPAINNSIGATGYQGLNPSTETLVASNIAASIQAVTITKSNENLPGDTRAGSSWNIFFKMNNGSVNDRDVITDDLGIRYQVTYAYWNSLGYKCTCERLQT